MPSVPLKKLSTSPGQSQSTGKKFSIASGRSQSTEDKEVLESLDGNHPEGSEVPLTRAEVAELVDKTGRNTVQYIKAEVQSFDSRCTDMVRREMNGIELPLRQCIDTMGDRVSAQESGLKACQNRTDSIEENLKANKKSVEEDLREVKEQLGREIDIVRKKCETISREVATISATVLTPESVDDHEKVRLQPLQEELSSLGIRLDAGISAVNSGVVRSAEIAKEVTELVNYCATLNSRLDALPLQTEEQIMGYLDKAIQEMNRLKPRFESSLDESASKSSTLAAELEAAESRTSWRTWLSSFTSKFTEVQGFVSRSGCALFEIVKAVYRWLYESGRNLKLSVTFVITIMALSIVVAFIGIITVRHIGNEVTVDSQSLMISPVEDQVFIYSFYPIAQ